MIFTWNLHVNSVLLHLIEEKENGMFVIGTFNNGMFENENGMPPVVGQSIGLAGLSALGLVPSANIPAKEFQWRMTGNNSC